MNTASSKPFVSICIPAYRRLDFLDQLMQSIAIQSFTDFEVIISDDSPDDSVKQYLDEKSFSFSISYFHHETSLGTPANWNFAIREAKGKWIKLMHDDDRFIDENGLQAFVDATKESQAKFIFSSFIRKDNITGAESVDDLPMARLKKLTDNPFLLLANNLIGPPSNTMVHHSLQSILYEERMKWLVDLEYYIRLLQKTSFHFIDQPLIYIGVSEEQVTSYSFNNAAIQVPEYSLMLEKYGINPLKNSVVFDAWWRAIRNLKIRSLADWKKYGGQDLPPHIKRMIRIQSKVPTSLLQKGIVSKSLMSFCFVTTHFG